MPHLLIIEPNSYLTKPYVYFPVYLQTTRVISLNQAAKIITLKNIPSLISISASFKPQDLVDFLDALKNECSQFFVPLVVVIDWNNPINTVLGTSWGEKIGVLDTNATQLEVSGMFGRLMGKG